MPTSTLLFSAALSLVSAALYSFVAYRVYQRPTSPSARTASVLFAIWWATLAAATVNGAMLQTLAAFDITPLGLFVVAGQVSLLLIVVALWALMYYLVYLFTGSSKSLVPLSVLYLLYYVLLVGITVGREATGVDVGRWSATVAYGTELSGPFGLVILVLLVGPQILGALAYFSLVFRVPDRTARYRILLVSTSIIVWFGGAFVGSVAGWSDFDWWQITNRFLALGASVTILVAFEPPEALQRWARIGPYDQNGPQAPRP